MKSTKNKNPYTFDEGDQALKKLDFQIRIFVITIIIFGILFYCVLNIKSIKAELNKRHPVTEQSGVNLHLNTLSNGL